MQSPKSVLDCFISLPREKTQVKMIYLNSNLFFITFSFVSSLLQHVSAMPASHIVWHTLEPKNAAASLAVLVVRLNSGALLATGSSQRVAPLLTEWLIEYRWHILARPAEQLEQSGRR